MSDTFLLCCCIKHLSPSLLFCYMPSKTKITPCSMFLPIWRVLLAVGWAIGGLLQVISCALRRVLYCAYVLYGIVLVMGLSLRYWLLYYFARMRGRDVTGADVSARSVAMRKIGKMIDARTQTLAKQICVNC